MLVAGIVDTLGIIGATESGSLRSGIMRRLAKAVLVLGLSCGFVGCATLPSSAEPGPKTLLSWLPGETKPEPAAEDKGEDKAKVEPLVTDRPDFTEASSTVGKGRVQLEGGYTHIRDRSGGALTTLHSYPEALLRIGLFADWFELRLGQNFGTARSSSGDGLQTALGANDLYLGVKLGMTEQKGLFPEVALVLQSQIPTGSREFTSNQVLPGANLLYGWDVIKDRLTIGGSTQANRALDDTGHAHVLFAQSLTVGYTLTERLGAYTEWFALFPSGAVADDSGPEHYLNGGFTYRVTPNFQLDIRAGVGLNERASDFFAGTGFAVRY